MRDFPFGFPLSGGVVDNSRFLSVWPLLSMLLDCCSLSNKQLLTHRNLHSGTGVTLLWSWHKWAILTVGFFLALSEGSKRKEPSISFEAMANTQDGGRGVWEQMHTQMSWLNT